MGRFLTKDSWGKDATDPLTYNSWLYVNANPPNYTDPTGYYKCIINSTSYNGGSTRCHKDIDFWLEKLAVLGGPTGKQLANYFRSSDHSWICSGDFCIDQKDLNVVEIADDVPVMQGGGNLIRIPPYKFVDAQKGTGHLIIVLGEFAHEIRHMEQGAFLHPSVWSEENAWEKEYQVFYAAGLYENNMELRVQDMGPLIAAQFVATNLSHVSWCYLMQTGFAKETYKGLPILPSPAGEIIELYCECRGNSK